MKAQIYIQPSKPLELRLLAVEFFGLFAITYASSWSIIFNDLTLLSNTGVALAHALVLLIFTWFAIPISGAHLNPAITLGLVVVKKLSWTPAALYIGAQFLGGIAGAAFISIQIENSILKRIKEMSVLGIPTSGNHDYEISGFWGETLGGFFMMYIFMSLILEAKRHKTETVGATALAFAVFAISMTFGEISGAGLNPARSMGPSIVSGRISKMEFIHVFGPIIGAIIASVIFNALYVDEDDDERDEIPLKPSNSGFSASAPEKGNMQFSQAEIEDLK